MIANGPYAEIISMLQLGAPGPTAARLIMLPVSSVSGLASVSVSV
jgi:hypothetical protein